MTRVLHVGASLWTLVVAVALLLFVLDRHFRSSRVLPGVARRESHLLRMSLLLPAGAWVLSVLGVLNWLTLVLWLAAGPLVRWLREHAGARRRVLQATFRRTASVVTDTLELGSGRARVRRSASAAIAALGASLASARRHAATPRGFLELVALAGVAAATLVTRFRQPLSELRLAHPDRYGDLLATRELLAGDLPASAGPQVHAALCAAVSLLGGTDPLHVVRVLPALLGCLLVLGVAHVTWRVTRNGAAALGAAFVLGALAIPHAGAGSRPWSSALAWTLQEGALRQWAGGGLELAALCLVALLARLVSDDVPGVPPGGGRAARWPWLDVACGLTVVAIAGPGLLLPAAAGVLLVPTSRALAVAGMVIAWLGLGCVSLFATTTGSGLAAELGVTSPVALALGVGLVLPHLERALTRLARLTALEAKAVALSTLLVASTLLGGSRVRGRFVEHDVSARAALALARTFPPRRWTVAAPPEQHAQVHGVGWHRDLARVVDEMESLAADPSRSIASPGEDLFVFVEKRPFAIVDVEPRHVPFDVVADPTWRNYRSPAGRSSLELAAAAACEAYRRTHSAEVWFEDDVLRIYRIRGPEPDPS